MIARPLDLASRLRPEPRNFDAWYYVNAAVLGLFFLTFGSRFVLAPGLEVDFSLPRVAGARAGAVAATHYITVKNSGQIFGHDGLMNLAQLSAWLQAEAAKTPQPVLLVKASSGVTSAQLAEISNAAHAARFRVIWAAEEPGPAEAPGPGG
jgi:biopolymer transport protein ExbD